MSDYNGAGATTPQDGGRVELELRHLLKDAFEKEQNTEPWRNLQLILAGGGANMPAYQVASKAAFGGLAENLGVEGLPVPQDFNLRGLPSAAFHRFAVAYGLAFDSVNLADISLPTEVSSLTYERASIAVEAPTKDVC